MIRAPFLKVVQRSNRYALLIVFGACVGLCSVAIHRVIDKVSKSSESLSFLVPSLMPWQSVGGCGAGGSGGGGGDAIRWIGQGVSGGYFELEVMPRYSFGRNNSTKSIAPRISYKGVPNYVFGLTLPLASKLAEVQYQSNMTPMTITTGGLSDISLSVSRALGAAGQYSLSASLSLPTGQYDIRRGTEANMNLLPGSLQMGSGLYGASLSFGYTKDVQDGLFLFDGSISYPLALRLISGKNEFLDKGEYFESYKDSTRSKRFYYRFKPYGENDLGDYTPPSLTLSAYYAYRGIPGYVHSFGVVGSVMTGVAWMHSYKSTIYDPRPDPDHKMWQMQFAYGLEFIRDAYPLFFGVSIPLTDQSPGDSGFDPTPMKKFDLPDFNNFLQQWTFALGVKTALF
ncbi:MAG: hypothetical protein JW795_16570 [Chitinivibrionales bacterium]|nr:hypothetical protein [Chitinivibrionales bacterium]